VTVQYEIEKTLSSLGIETEMEAYRSLLGHEGKGVEPLVQSLEEIHEYLFGKKLNPETPDRASIWTDTNVYNELGIPAVKIGPRGTRIGPRAEELDIDEMVKAAQIYALVAVDICNRERPGAS
jgi:acetylornithine deacetylase/succinyl-diaminopimelate desuccinylase-like protein